MMIFATPHRLLTTICRVIFIFLLGIGSLQSQTLTSTEIISHLRVQEQKKTGHVLLQWATHPNNTSTLIVKRHFRPMSSLRIFNQGKTIATLRARHQNFIEKDAPEGVHYYAVITKSQLNATSNLIFQAQENYTDKPYVVYRPQISSPKIVKEKLPENLEVDELTAINAKESVILIWAPAISQKKIVYKIYRSDKPLDTKEAIANSTQIGTTSKKRPQFEDKFPLENQDIYYGVVVKRHQKSKEFKGLELNKSYIKHRYIIYKEGELEEKPKEEEEELEEELKKDEPVNIPVYPNNSIDKLDHILANTYLKNNYKLCDQKLSHFIYQITANDEAQAKARFFLGLCNYKAKSYYRALRFFSDKQVKGIYPKRSRFWFEKSIRKVKL